MCLFAEVRYKVCRGMNLSNRYNIPDPAPVRLNRTTYQMHTCSRIDIACILLLRDNVETLNIDSEKIRVQGTENHVNLNN